MCKTADPATPCQSASRGAMASCHIQALGHGTSQWLARQGILAGIATQWQREKIYGNWHQWVGRIPGFPFEVSAATSTIVLVIVLDLLLVQSCSAPHFPRDPALHGDFRNPHSLNLTYLHQRRKDGNKSYPSETKTVQILLWPGRRPSFHFNHFETFSLT